VIPVRLTTDDGAVTRTVANDGAPIPLGVRERNFEPFTRLDEIRSLDRRFGEPTTTDAVLGSNCGFARRHVSNIGGRRRYE
jgi:hypothetical protein